LLTSVGGSGTFTWRLTSEPARTRLVLVGEIDIAAHDELLRAVSAVSATEVPLVVDLGAVTFVDGSGITALMALTQTAVDRGIAVGFTDRPPVVDRVLDLTATTLRSLEASTRADV
jgi:anti-sigma B factor antagonist